MSFQPIIPTGGLAGWTFLNRTLEAQKEAFGQSTQYRREEDYFRANIGNIETAEQLVADRRLLAFSLSAFGLDADLPNKFFIQKILSDGTSDNAALSNRLSDKTYREFSDAFGLGQGQVRKTQQTSFADEIIQKYETQKFEESVGNVNDDLRLALNLKREISDLASSDMSERAKLFTVLGSPPLRTTFETAFRLPSAFAGLDIDRQVTVLEEKLESAFGDASISQFKDPDLSERLIQKFLLQSELSSFEATSSPAATALFLLRS
ncbi:protein of unknown function DUF1217 [Dinoroseobacter shibae DFL 12 = DSM 16493]|jgi:hypothetical protein|uniref:Flagellar protein n=1 Tax=Dinoroseobacter shibae (strain DSM 16493 / NCIMB 14021 / DFL 12) TaxID=398580 RepID=A8LNJ7_DINSH|nr:DUF1217 domain-containing protein [Dinoroseobacter shibae]ABV95091.1 protein of unknown function DUF1217 [Dinoroseobacter shibae DFL 12 = DSM 16493]URF46506.1 DUF1217 domain-containing protein [Dinoroseobacter shibae]URF50812.1 DUF1217 domain-containing protein [Dinoroseobacter shibae]